MDPKHKHPATSSIVQLDRHQMDHKEWCSDGYYETVAGSPISGEFSQIHHLLCVGKLKDSSISDQVNSTVKMEFLRECLKLTDWDINESYNTVGLPLKPAFIHLGAPSGWDGWPCHQVEHNTYEDQVEMDLNANVWVQVLKLQKKCKDCKKKCNINAEGIETQLTNESQRWRDFLSNRGKGLNVGTNSTAWCWKNRKSIKGSWYKPFSMNPGKPAKRECPDDRVPPQTIQDYCSELMFKLLR
jgi:hypothetical protein